MTRREWSEVMGRKMARARLCMNMSTVILLSQVVGNTTEDIVSNKGIQATIQELTEMITQRMDTLKNGGAEKQSECYEEISKRVGKLEEQLKSERELSLKKIAELQVVQEGKGKEKVDDPRAKSGPSPSVPKELNKKTERVKSSGVISNNAKGGINVDGILLSLARGETPVISAAQQAINVPSSTQKTTSVPSSTQISSSSVAPSSSAPGADYSKDYSIHQFKSKKKKS
jgi:hypothetical protein